MISRNKILTILLISLLAVSGSSCSGVFGPSDETAAAGAIIQEANLDLRKIKEIYEKNEGDDETEGKREQLKKALEANNAEEVKKISNDVVYLINDGKDFAKSAIEKIQRAQDMNINDDYKEYLRLKEMALAKQVDAFDQYREAARSLRDNYDPKNEALRAKVKTEFDQRSDKYRELMETARDHSSQANELAKEAMRRKT